MEVLIMLVNENVYRQYQNHVIGYSEIVYYDQILMNGKYREAIKREPMVGIRVLLKDTCAYNAQSPAQRIQYINSGLYSVLNETGCFLRESKSMVMPDGFWLVSFPVPRSQLTFQIDQIQNVIINLGRYLGFVCIGLVEISISGRGNRFELTDRLSTVILPEKYRSRLVKQETGSTFISYNFGCIIPINARYSLIKTRWCIDSESLKYDGLRETIEEVSLRLSSAFY
jgi:hypothetical protein